MAKVTLENKNVTFWYTSVILVLCQILVDLDFVWGGSCVLLLPDESIEQLDLPQKMVPYVSSASLIECESTTKFTISSTSLIVSGVLIQVLIVPA
jgi:hypothetical protein